MTKIPTSVQPQSPPLPRRYIGQRDQTVARQALLQLIPPAGEDPQAPQRQRAQDTVSEHLAGQPENLSLADAAHLLDQVRQLGRPHSRLETIRWTLAIDRIALAWGLIIDSEKP